MTVSRPREVGVWEVFFLINIEFQFQGVVGGGGCTWV